MGAVENAVTAKVCAALVPQLLEAVTLMLPLLAAPFVDTVMESVFVPAVIDQPAGKVQVYEVAFGTEAIEYFNPFRLIQAEVLPVMAPGVAGVPAPTVTASVLAVLVPQVLEAVTLIFPFCPVVPDDTVIDAVPWPAVIVHPVGTAHVYEVA